MFPAIFQFLLKYISESVIGGKHNYWVNNPRMFYIGRK